MLYTIILFVGAAYGFSGNNNHRQNQYQHTPTTKLFADGGAGAWREKSKEFLSNPDEFDAEKKLNIAFVVSMLLFIVCLYLSISRCI